LIAALVWPIYKVITKFGGIIMIELTAEEMAALGEIFAELAGIQAKQVELSRKQQHVTFFQGQIIPPLSPPG
jgi:hypothetical protein